MLESWLSYSFYFSIIPEFSVINVSFLQNKFITHKKIHFTNNYNKTPQLKSILLYFWNSRLILNTKSMCSLGTMGYKKVPNNSCSKTLRLVGQIRLINKNQLAPNINQNRANS